MKKFKTILISALILGICSHLFAETKKVQDLIDSKYCDELIKNGVVTVVQEEGENPLVLVPDSEYAEKIRNNRVLKNEKDFPFTYESVYYKSKAELLKASNSTKSTLDMNDISRVLRSVSNMQGMKYYSTTRKKTLVLYDKAYTVDGENSDTQIPDKNTGNADGLQVYCLQDDSSFGVNHYRLNYYQKDDSMLAFFTVTDVLGLGPIKAIYPENLKISIFVQDLGDYIILYLCTDLDSVKFPGIKAQIEDSMTSRMDAIYNWFLVQFK